MYEVFMYPVSGIMKFWHWLISSFVGESTAWLISIILLVITVRGVVVPLNWISVRSARIGALIRPENNRIKKQMNNATTTEEMAELMQEEKNLMKSYNYNPAAGCVPPLVMIPAFIGLYQVLLRMSNIERGSTTVGMLNASDVSAFRETTFYGAPLTDFAREHGDLIIPSSLPPSPLPWLIPSFPSCAVSAPLNLIRRSTAASSYSWAFCCW